MNQVAAQEPLQFAEAAIEIVLLTAIEGPLGLGALAGLIGAMGGFIAGPQPEGFSTSAEKPGRIGMGRDTSEDGGNEDDDGHQGPGEPNWP